MTVFAFLMSFALAFLVSTASAEHFVPRSKPNMPISYGSKRACEKALHLRCVDMGEKWQAKHAHPKKSGQK